MISAFIHAHAVIKYEKFQVLKSKFFFKNLLIKSEWFLRYVAFAGIVSKQTVTACVPPAVSHTQTIQPISSLYPKTSKRKKNQRRKERSPPHLRDKKLFKKYFSLSHKRIIRIKKERRQKEMQKKQKLTENRRHLADVRVVQKNLVFVVGLSPRLADHEVLKKNEYFGRFGKIQKIVINPSPSYAGTQVEFILFFSLSLFLFFSPPNI